MKNIELYKKGFNFPKYPNHEKGYRLLFDIYIYLSSKLKNPKHPKYPPWILNSKLNIETQKRYFRKISNNYRINELNNLMIIKKKNLAL